MAGGEKKNSDLGVRAASAMVMVAVAGTALWLGGWLWTIFALAIAAGVLFEWSQLVRGFEQRPVLRAIWLLGGLFYVGLAVFVLIQMRLGAFGMSRSLLLILTVIAIDVGAYFTGRTFGGPKIAPAISPSKTWSGLFGGMLGAALVLAGYIYWFMCYDPAYGHCGLPGLADLRPALLGGAALAVVAQSGDFFESRMKRRAGVKDSGKLIPGHGGLFDRVDGLLAVSFVLGLLSLHSFILPE